MASRGTAHIAVLIAAVCLSSGCTSTATRLNEASAARERAWEESLRSRSQPSAALPGESLSWNRALEILKARNEKLQSADFEILRAQESLRQIHRSLIPLINFQAGYNRALKDAQNGFDPFTFAANVFIDVPGVFNYRARLLAGELLLRRALLARELLLREQTIELYRSFNAFTPLGQASARSAALRQIAAALTTDSPTSPLAADLARSAATQTKQSGRSEAVAIEHLSDVLGTPGTAYSPDVSTLPDLGYLDSTHRPDPASMARLQLRLAAVELVALRARALGARLRSFPDLNIYITSPGVYRYANNQQATWSSEQIVIGANVNWSLDTQGRRASDRRMLAVETTLRRNTLAAEEERNADQLRTTLAELTRIDQESSRIDAALRELTATPLSDTSRSPLQANLQSQRTQLDELRLEWSLVLWFFDDARWPVPNPDRPLVFAASTP
ncbi:hypothetical protein [Rariglobus hedericola]|uniref:TolC family protein n=1 Tax=Rariglobus hedericola TaxID=2597822 RepID=A0A556QIS9_9BACT|nr:hypothetical protein [Rariglobus hedericola]TSJ76554.1 hypothetical protein FPL22_10505 [Rariglobus hedericola]